MKKLVYGSIQPKCVIKTEFKKKRVVVWLCILFTLNNIQSQTNNREQEQQINSDIEGLINKAIQTKNFVKAAKLAHDHSISFYKKKNYNLAIIYAKKETEAFVVGGIKNSNYINAVYNIGRFSYLNKDYDTAIKYYLSASKLGDQVLKAKSYCSLARVYDVIGDFYKAISYYENGIKEYESINMYVKSYLHYSNLAGVYDKINTKTGIERKLQVLQRLDSLSNHFPFGDVRRYFLNNHFGNTYGSRFNYNFEKAIFYYKKNLVFGKKYKDSAIYETTFTNLADLYLREKRDSTKYFVGKGLKYVKRKEVKAILFDNLSQYYLHKNELNLSLLHINNAINTNIGFVLKKNKVLSKIQILNSQSINHLLFCFKKKTEILIKLFEKKKNSSYLNEIICIAKSTDHLVSLILNTNSESKTKKLWREESSEVYANGILAAQLSNNDSLALFFMERNKALMLTETIIKNTDNEKLPTIISRKDAELHKNIYALEHLLSSTSNIDKQSRLNDSLFLMKENYDQFVDSVKTFYKKSFRNKFKIEQVTLGEVKRNLEESSVILSFSYQSINKNNQRLLGLMITKNTTISFQINDVQLLDSYIKKYSSLVSKPLLTKEMQKEFRNVAYNLYSTLFPSDVIRNSVEGKRLVIIPEGNLHNISFEALVTNKETHGYLIEKTIISYVYSMSFLRNNALVQRKSNNKVISFAPISYEDSLVKLNNAGLEVKLIQKNIGSELFTGKLASKKNFYKESNKYKIIHLATHASATKNPWIAFSDDKMELHELYNYKNNADLVVLSACNTSLGEKVSGEGVLSLARGFLFSGAKSVVSSLWNVNDKSTAFIMAIFYENINKGQTKAEALSNAKKTYLETHSLLEKSPYYWSSFVLIGDSGPIDLSTNKFYYWCFGVLIIVILFLYRKKTG
mgnify:CR=1 FL=1